MNELVRQLALAALGCTPATAWWIPGRIEILGKHTDYGGGEVLTCATDCGLVVVGAPDATPLIRVRSGAAEVVLDLQGSTTSAAPGTAAWAIYVATVVRRLARNFPGRLRGARLAIASDLPPAAGLSSSSALLTGLLLALADLAGLVHDADWPTDLAAWAASVENGSDFPGLPGAIGVGTRGGAMDHTAIVGSCSGAITHWTLAPTRRLGDLPLPDDTSLLIAVSGVIAEKTGAAMMAYNGVADAAHDCLAAWNRSRGRSDATLAAAVLAGATPTALSDLRLARRLEHFRLESTQLVPAAAAALATGDIQAFTAAAAASQDAAERLLGNQVPETSALARLAPMHGALAASAFGAGFGGAVWALCRDGEAAEISRNWLAAYQERFHRSTPQIIRVTPGPGLHRLPAT